MPYLNKKKNKVLYHSGLEGFVRPMVNFLGLASSNKGWSIIAGEVLPEYEYGNRDKMNDFWTLKNEVRIKHFENYWLNKDEVDCLKADMQNGQLTKDEYVECRCTIALEECVKSILGNDHSKTLKIVANDKLRKSFLAEVLPDVCEGFDSAGYRDVDRDAFSRKIIETLEEAHEYASVDLKRNFATLLVAGLIYGPGHPLFNGFPYETTMEVRESRLEADGAIVLSQIFDERGAMVCSAKKFSPGKVVFIGRSSDLEDYKKRIDDVSFPDEIDGLDFDVFPVSGKCLACSWTHGALVNQGVGCDWFYYDMGSTYGSMVYECEGSPQGAAKEPKLISAGDRIGLGVNGLSEQSKIDDEDKPYLMGAVLSVAMVATPVPA